MREFVQGGLKVSLLYAYYVGENSNIGEVSDRLKVVILDFYYVGIISKTGIRLLKI